MSYLKVTRNDNLLPLHWWQNYALDFIREFPGQHQLEMVDLLSRFLLIWRCIGAFKPDTGWLKQMESTHRLTVRPSDSPPEEYSDPKKPDLSNELPIIDSDFKHHLNREMRIMLAVVKGVETELRLNECQQDDQLAMALYEQYEKIETLLTPLMN